MAKDIADIALNPVRVRIIQALAMSDELTTAEIGTSMSDVSRTTLYRHINILIDAGLIRVVREKKIRGSIERTLALNADELADQMSGENPSPGVFRFLMGTYGKFEKHFSRDDIDPRAEKFFVTNAIMMMSDDEFTEFLDEFQTLMKNYYFQDAASEGGTLRKPRDITVISAPPQTQA